jgi:FlaA1/EpsC-like NDP-sugar epimerase
MPTDRRHHPSTNHVLFYLALFTTEATLLGSVFWSGTNVWPTWSIASIVLANLFFALIAGNHHFGKVSKQMAAHIILAALSLLTLVALTILVAFRPGGPAILAYAWLCTMLVNILHYYPGRSWKTKKRKRYERSKRAAERPSVQKRFSAPGRADPRSGS